MMRKVCSLFIFNLIFVVAGTSQYDVTFKLQNYAYDTLVIGYYLGEKTLARDTLVSDDQSVFHFQGEESLEPGVYLALKRPDNGFMQLFMNDEDQNFEVTWDVQNPLSIEFKGSQDNEVFQEYIRYLEDKRVELDKLNEEKMSVAGTDTVRINKEIEALDAAVKQRQQEIIDNNPNTISALFLKSNLQPEMPEFSGTEQEIREQEYYYYKKHYFDNLDLSNPAMIRTPFVHNRVMNYVNRLTPQIPDSIIASVDEILQRFEGSEDGFRYYLSQFLNEYASKPIIGMDAVYVHLVDHYYAQGRAPWIDEEVLDEIITNANNIRGALIGKVFPDITTFKKDSTPVRIHDVDAEYKVVIFWKHDCGHCKKSMPKVVDFQKDFRDQGVQVITICTKDRNRTQDCIDYVDEHDMGELINTFDERSQWRRKIYINSTPKIYILGPDNKILLKDLGAEKLAEAMPQIMARNQEK